MLSQYRNFLEKWTICNQRLLLFLCCPCSLEEISSVVWLLEKVYSLLYCGREEASYLPIMQKTAPTLIKCICRNKSITYNAHKYITVVDVFNLPCHANNITKLTFIKKKNERKSALALSKFSTFSLHFTLQCIRKRW